MTKKLSDQAKKEKKDARKQQKAPSTTSTHVTQPKHEGPAPTDAGPVNLCDSCAYEVGQCEGKPKFAIDQDPELTGAAADAVVACEGFLNVADMPTADQAKKDAKAGAAAEQPAQEPGPAAAHDGGDKGQSEAEEEEPGKPEEPRFIPSPGPVTPDPKRFKNDKTDYGACPSCERPLKRTAFNRYFDTVRCTNPRCRAYRAVVKTVPTGVK